MPARTLPVSDQRACVVKNLRTPRAFPVIRSRAEWEERAQRIRRQILVSCGLWPMPEKAQLRAQISGRVAGDGYSVEKVALETLPGFYLGGNLYRPLGRGSGSCPGVLNPHGHWPEGRLVDTEAGSVPARCIQFARLGMVAFSYDMIGYNDTFFPDHPFDGHYYNRHRLFAADRCLLLWGINQMGLQTWNSICALDFLESLPEVDGKRLGCTGASGGATQTFILGAIDDRLAAVAPVVMVSHSMQGGCSCENAAGLRIDFSNMEISAAVAPKAQILVAATGDWTRTTASIEGPAVEGVYRMLGAADRFRHVTFDFEHNYNRESRNAVYAWFGRWLLGHPEPDSLREADHEVIHPETWRVFPTGRLPASASTEAQCVERMKGLIKRRISALQASDSAELEAYRRAVTPAWERVLQVEVPGRGLIVETASETRRTGYTAKPVSLGREGRGDRVGAVHFVPDCPEPRGTVILAHPGGQKPWLDPSGRPEGLAGVLLGEGMGVVLVDLFLTGDRAGEAGAGRDPFTGFFTTYNRTDAQERVQDLLTAIAYARQFGGAQHVALAGFHRAGLWAMLASPAADAVAADWDATDSRDEESMLARDTFVPALLGIGGFEGVAMLAAPRPLLLHHTAGKAAWPRLEAAYTNLGAGGRLCIEDRLAGDDRVAGWLSTL